MLHSKAVSRLPRKGDLPHLQDRQRIKWETLRCAGVHREAIFGGGIEVRFPGVRVVSWDKPNEAVCVWVGACSVSN